MRYPKVRTLGHRDTDGILSMGKVVLLEKVDGANFRFRYDRESGRLLFGSRRQLFEEHGEPADIERVNKSFRHAVEYVLSRVDMDEVERIDAEAGGAWFFGESLHKHSLDYDAWEDRHPDEDDSVPNFLGFDVYSEGQDAFLPHTDMVDAYSRLNLETAPVIKMGDASEFEAENIEIPESVFRNEDPEGETEFDRRGLAEGVVIRNESLGIRAKVVHEEFSEASWSSTDPEAQRVARGTAEVFVKRFATTARIRKHAHKLVDEGHYDGLEMPMMARLPQRVAEDIFSEHGWEILNDDELDLTAAVKEEIRSKLSRRCSRVLQQSMTVE